MHRPLALLLAAYTAAQAQSAPICGDGEELFRLQLQTGTTEGEFGTWGASVSYRIFTESQSNTHAECLQCRNDFYPGENVELCLPKNQCHTAVVGRNVGRWISCYNGGVEELVMTWGNETIKRNNAYLFERVDFGDGCQAKCDESESEFEFFLDRMDLYTSTEEFTWDLSEAETGTSVHQGGIEAPYNQSAFVYERICIPKSSCYNFDMGYPANMTNETDFYDSNMYSTRLDGAVYGESKLNMGFDLFTLDGEDKLREVITLGDECKAKAVCSSNETLIELEFNVNSEVDCYADSENNFTSSSAVSSMDFGFWIKDQDTETYSRNYYTHSAYNEDFETGKTYSSIVCIPSKKCAKLYVLDGIPATYRVYQDGTEMTQRVVHTDEDSLDKGTVTTDLGEVSLCSPGLVLSLSYYGLFAAAAGALALLMC